MPTVNLFQPHARLRFHARPAILKLPTLRQGSSGSTVRVLQQLLNFKGFALEVDGKFGPYTREAVKNFQYINDLPGDGIVDVKTWYHLGSELLPFAF
ncbi:MAG: peptidoglycan-binding protein [Coleofasciculus sp. S288]|nr:peptidoglycan-binding protein [Coleofasciculus sp. S288]